MHVVTGLPRSGSTLFCNLLNQNPDFYASSTSILAGLVHSFSRTVSDEIETKSNLASVEQRSRRSLRAMCNAWHQEPKIIFDKGRGWVHNLLILKDIYPAAKVIILIRDLREVLASIEKHHRANPILDLTAVAAQRGLTHRTQALFSADGIVGHCLMGIQDILARNLDVFWIKFEDFAQRPGQIMVDLYKYLEEPIYNHNFDNVKNVSEEADNLYLNKFPHKGEGKIALPPTSWPNYMSANLAESLMEQFAWYNDKFGYAIKARSGRLDVTPIHR